MKNSASSRAVPKDEDAGWGFLPEIQSDEGKGEWKFPWSHQDFTSTTFIGSFWLVWHFLKQIVSLWNECFISHFWRQQESYNQPCFAFFFGCWQVQKREEMGLNLASYISKPRQPSFPFLFLFFCSLILTSTCWHISILFSVVMKMDAKPSMGHDGDTR